MLEERGDADPAVLAHHAEGAGQEKAVLRHAPEAARCSAALGAHREAAAQYERALRFASELDRPALASLQESVAGEYALLDRWEETERALRAALDLRRQLGDDLSIGEDLRLLSRTLWRLCRGKEEVEAAQEAVHILAALPPGRELAWAYACLGALYGGTGRIDEGLELLGKAQALGELLHEPGLVSYALNQQGITLVGRGRDGTESIDQALGIALDADLQEAAGLAYSNLQEAASRLNMFAEAERYYAEGRAYCEERELGVYSVCLQGWRAVTLALLGQWAEATDISAQVLDTTRISPVNRLNPLRVLGSIRGRRGEAGVWDLLDEALVLAEGLDEPLWIVSVRAARAELRWISGQLDLAIAEARSGYDRGLGRVDPWLLGSVAIWLFRLQQPIGEASGLPEPLTLEMAGDGPGAAAAWERLGRTYDAALVRLGSSEEAAPPAGLGHPGRPRRPGHRRAGQAADEDARDQDDPARTARGHPGDSGRADGPRARGPCAALRGPARPRDLPAAGHFRAHRSPPRLRGAGQDRRLVPDPPQPAKRPAWALKPQPRPQPRHSPRPT